MNLSYTQLPFISTNQWQHQVISINLKLKLEVQTEILIEITN